MRRHPPGKGRRLFLATALLLVPACDGGTSTGAPAPDLVPVERPDLTAHDDRIREQIASHFDALERAPDGPDASELAQRYGELGKVLLAYEFYDRAREAFENARTLDPREFQWPYYVGYLEQQAGNAPEALAALEQARRLDPGSIPALIRIVQMHMDSPRPEQAEEHLVTLAEIAPDEPLVRFLRGREALRRGDPEGALEHFQRALEVSETSTAVHYQIARAYQALGDTESARRHMQQRGGVHIPPPDPWVLDLELMKQGSAALASRAAALMEAQRFPEAAAAYAAAIESDPENASLLLNLGAALGQMGRTEGARAAFERAVEVDPTNSEALFNIGLVHVRGGDGRRALESLTAALEHDPDNIRAHQLVAELLRKAGRCDEAIPHFQAVQRARPAFAPVRVQLAICLTANGSYREAIDSLEAGHGAAPHEMSLIDALARVLASAPVELRNGARALELAHRLEVAEIGMAARETLAMASAAAGRFDDARRIQTELIAHAQERRQTVWLEHLRDNLERFRSGEVAGSAWPGFMYEPGGGSR